MHQHNRLQHILSEQSSSNTIKFEEQFRGILTSLPSPLLSKRLHIWNETIFSSLEDISVQDYVEYCTSKFSDHHIAQVISSLSSDSPYIHQLQLANKVEDPDFEEFRGELLYALAHQDSRKINLSPQDIEVTLKQLDTAIEILIKKENNIGKPQEGKIKDIRKNDKIIDVESHLFRAYYLLGTLHNISIEDNSIGSRDSILSIARAIAAYNNAIFYARKSGCNENFIQQELAQEIAELLGFMGQWNQAYDLLKINEEEIYTIGVEKDLLIDFDHPVQQGIEEVLHMPDYEKHNFTEEAVQYSDALLEMENQEFTYLHIMNKLKTAYVLIHLSDDDQSHITEILSKLRYIKEFFDEEGALEDTNLNEREEVKKYHLVLGMYYVLCTKNTLDGLRVLEKIPTDETCDIYLEAEQLRAFIAHNNGAKASPSQQKNEQPGKVVRFAPKKEST